MYHQLLSVASDILNITNPLHASIVKKLLSSFHRFFEKLWPDLQCMTYSFLGQLINTSLLAHSTSFPCMDDLRSLLESNMSTKSVYEKTDDRLKNFIDASTKITNTTHAKNRSEVSKSKREYQLYNIVENMLAARNQRCVTPPGLSQMILVYIFGGRSKLICDLFAKQGAKGCYTTVTQKILLKSEKKQSESLSRRY